MEAVVSGKVNEQLEGRQDLSDEDFISQWFDASFAKFQPLHAPIEILRKRDWRQTFYAGQATRTAK